MRTDSAGAVQDFYERFPYPPAVDSLDTYQSHWQDPQRLRADYHLFWPAESYKDDFSILVAGCGTSQAAKHALRWRAAHVIGIDFSAASVRSTQALQRKYDLDNLEVYHLPIERIGELGMSFDQIVCTGVLHHLPAITAITAQNTLGVKESLELSPELVRQQIDAVASDITVDACKTGMLANEAIIEVVEDAISGVASGRAGNFAVARPTREVLFTVLRREDKYKAKSFIDTFVYRAGDQIGAWSYPLLTWFGLGLTGISFVAAPLAAIWCGLSFWLGRKQAALADKKWGGAFVPR
jgi:SAM-dependent methyltransferase